MKNKNKNILFVAKSRGRKRKNANEIWRTFVASMLIVTITSSLFSFVDNKATNLREEKELDNENLLTTEDIINKLFVINKAGAATVDYRAKSYETNSKVYLTGKPGEIINYTLKYKNVGTYLWRQSGQYEMVLRVKGNRFGVLQTSNWKSASVAAGLSTALTSLNADGTFNISLMVPETKTTETYVMYVKYFDIEVPGSEVEITVEPNTSAKSSNATVSAATVTEKIVSRSYGLYEQNAEIKKLQQFLNNNGYTVAKSGLGSKGRETEYFGPATVNALKAFQKANGLSVTGTLNNETINKINNFNSVNSSTVSNSSNVIETVTEKIVSRSYSLYEQNAEIKKLQQFLNNNGYTVANSGLGSKGRETEYFGPATVNALKAFQKANGLSVTGTLTNETINKINNFKSADTSSLNLSNSNSTAVLADANDVRLEDVSYITSDKAFEVIDTVTNNTVLAVKANEKVNVFFNQVTKEYFVSKDGFVMYSSKNKIGIKNTSNGNLNLGGKINNTSMIALKSDFDVKVNTTNNNGGTVVCASVDCNLVDNNTNANVVNNQTQNINSGSVVTTNGNTVNYFNHQYIKGHFNIRVGISYELLPATISNTTTYNVVDGNGNFITQVNPGEKIVINFNESSRLYSVTKNGQLVIQTSNYLKLQNPNSGIFTIENMTLNPYGVNYNKFRGNLELRHNTTYNHAWIINELDIEDYLKGIGESSNSSSYEYLKAMAVTSRTYATYHYLVDAKNAAQYFHVFSTTSDQVYYGYAREVTQPNVVRAVEETTGMYVIYDGKIIQAFYSANAGGRTRTLSETWGGKDLPYLQAVPDTYTKNDARYGHGVGMSQVGAMRMIAYDNADFIKVLTYYYTGTQVLKLY